MVIHISEAIYKTNTGIRLIFSLGFSNNFPLAGTCTCPPGPSNGRISYCWRSRSVGSLIRYYCNSGYSAVGSTSRTCQRGGYWSGSAAVCLRSELPIILISILTISYIMKHGYLFQLVMSANLVHL